MIRDTSQFKPFRAIKNGGTPSLKKLSEEVLGVKIQEGEHNSVGFYSSCFCTFMSDVISVDFITYFYLLVLLFVKIS